MLRNKERRALRERSSPIVGEVIRRRNARSMDGAAQSSYLSQGGSYLCKSHVTGDRGAVDTHTFAYRCDGFSRKHCSPGTQNGPLISIPTVPPQETLQITDLTALNSLCLCRAYTHRRLIGIIHYRTAGLFQATGHSW